MNELIEIQCFPVINYFKILANGAYVEIDASENFKKMSFRNRYVVAGANGLISLTIPIVGGREQKALITHIEIDNTTPWQKQHWKTLTSAYNKAPFFSFYKEEIKELIFNPETNLFSFNFFIIERVCKLLNVNTSICFTHNYSFDYSEDFRNKFLPRNYQQGTDNWKPRYSQVFEDRLGFQPNLSILDLVFCEGPNAANVLKEV